MRVTEITLTKSITINLERYENAKVEARATVALDEGDDIEEATSLASQQVYVMLGVETEDILAALPDTQRELWEERLGLPDDTHEADTQPLDTTPLVQ